MTMLPQKLTSWSRILLDKLTVAQKFMVPEGSLPCSQESTNDTYSEPDKPSSYTSILFLYDPFWYCLLSYVWVFQVTFFHQAFLPKLCIKISSILYDQH
jgi:hypothetical protein